MLDAAKRHAELAQRISAAAQDLQRSDEHDRRFVRPWRMSAQQDDSETLEHISCSSGECGCGISPDVE